jgi:mRNA deadenylase 3'-5' endonuclease subunit Ccr4
VAVSFIGGGNRSAQRKSPAVDYIFYSANSLDVRGILEVAAESVITETGGIPDATFPSDHVSIKSILSFKLDCPRYSCID